MYAIIMNRLFNSLNMNCKEENYEYIYSDFKRIINNRYYYMVIFCNSNNIKINSISNLYRLLNLNCKEDIMNKYFNLDNSEGFTETECNILDEWIEQNITDREDRQKIKYLQERATVHADEIIANYNAK